MKNLDKIKKLFVLGSFLNYSRDKEQNLSVQKKFLTYFPTMLYSENFFYIYPSIVVDNNAINKEISSIDIAGDFKEKEAFIYVYDKTSKTHFVSADSPQIKFNFF